MFDCAIWDALDRREFKLRRGLRPRQKDTQCALTFVNCAHMDDYRESVTRYVVALIQRRTFTRHFGSNLVADSMRMSFAIASAGGICILNARRIPIEQIMVSPTPVNVA